VVSAGGPRPYRDAFRFTVRTALFTAKVSEKSRVRSAQGMINNNIKINTMMVLLGSHRVDAYALSSFPRAPRIRAIRSSASSASNSTNGLGAEASKFFGGAIEGAMQQITGDRTCALLESNPAPLMAG
jgi:hypothetical protein